MQKFLRFPSPSLSPSHSILLFSSVYVSCHPFFVQLFCIHLFTAPFQLSTYSFISPLFSFICAFISSFYFIHSTIFSFSHQRSNMFTQRCDSGAQKIGPQFCFETTDLSFRGGHSSFSWCFPVAESYNMLDNVS